MLKNYLKVAFKVFWRHKFFTGVNLFGICFTLVVLMVAAAIFDQEAGPVPPEVHSDRTLYLPWLLVQTIWQVSSDSSGSGGGHGDGFRSNFGMSYAFLDRLVRPLETAQKVTVFSGPAYRGLYGGAEEGYVEVRMTDAEYWEVFRFDFRQGRPYTAEEAESGDMAAVISAGFGRRFFGSEEAVGRSVPVDGRNYRVVGVVVPGMTRRTRADVWVPATTGPPEEWRVYKLQGRFQAAVLAPKPADIERVRAEFATALEQAEPPLHDDDHRSYRILPTPLFTKFEEWILEEEMHEYAQRELGPNLVAALVLKQMLIWGGYILLFMLLPALHLVNLNIGRIEERTSEIGVRKSFGASTRTLVGQFVAENVLLTLVGGALSLPFSWGMLSLFGGYIYIDTGVFFRTFFYGVLLALFFGVFSGAWPAWKMARLHPVRALTGKGVG